MPQNNSMAILTKARAMYGKLLTQQQYSEMMKCKTVSEVAGYLKNNTHFSTALQNISESTIHRGQLENLLRKSLFDQYARMYRYLVDNSRSLFYYIIVKEEIREILRMVLLLKADNAKSFIIDLPGFLINKTNIDLLAVARATNFDELVLALKGTDYEEILNKFRPTPEKPEINYVACEHSFYEYYNKSLFNAIKTKYRGQEQKDLLALLSVETELLNLSHIYRAKCYRNISKAEAVSRIYPYYYKMRAKDFNELLDIEGVPTLKEFIDKTPYGKYFTSVELPYIENYTTRILNYACSYKIHFTSYASVAFYSYVMVSQVEFNNVINIIESIRYGVSEDEIRKIIVSRQKRNIK